MTKPTQTPKDQAKKRIYEQGLTVKQWAEEHQYPVPEVYKVLNGERKGLYGRSHQIATALGLKYE